MSRDASSPIASIGAVPVGPPAPAGVLVLAVTPGSFSDPPDVDVLLSDLCASEGLLSVEDLL